jgi:hypothetical protein
VTFQRVRPDRGPKSEHRQAVGLVSPEQDADLIATEQLAHALGECVGAGGGLVELGIEVTEKPAYGLGVRDLCAAHHDASAAAPGTASPGGISAAMSHPSHSPASITPAALSPWASPENHVSARTTHGARHDHRLLSRA